MSIYFLEKYCNVVFIMLYYEQGGDILEIGNRIRELRKELGMNQTDFASKIGLKQSAIGLYENNDRRVSDQTIKLICTEFDVNEQWLRTGEGEMFRKISPDEEFARIMMEVQISNDPIIRRIISTYWKLTPEEKAGVQKMVQCFVDEDAKQASETIPYIARSGDQGETRITKDAQEEALRALDESSDPDL